MIWLSTTSINKSNSIEYEQLNSVTKDEIIKELKIAFNSVSTIVKTIFFKYLTSEVDFYTGSK